MPSKRDIERWVEQREPQAEAGGTTIEVTDEIVESGWQPPAGERKPEAGVTSERFRLGPGGVDEGEGEGEGEGEDESDD